MAEQEVDFLEVDRPIPGQNYVCLSFISPDKVLENKNLYTLYKFHLSMNEGSDLTFSQFREKYEDYADLNEGTLQKEFDEICDFQTNVRGIKIRGVYDTQREANVRAQVLQKMDNSFHVYVGQVGYWLPWDPNPNNVEDQEYLNKDLNRLNKEYNKNQAKRDMFYEEQKREKKMAAIQESEDRKKKIQEEATEVNEVNVSNEIDTSTETVVETPVPAEPSSEENVTMNVEDTIVHDGETVGTNETEKTLEQALNDVDPWMQRKMEEELTKNENN
tara:strand:+ start:249 stop:1070 length:822 start_codon:yes stop_codon:yes gene_type:complete